MRTGVSGKIYFTMKEGKKKRKSKAKTKIEAYLKLEHERTEQRKDRTVQG